MADERRAWTLTDFMPPSQHPAPHAASVRDLTSDQLDVVFQPIVDLSDGSCFAVEGLVRCNQEEFRSPLTLFEHAVAQEACGRLGRTIREVAFEHLDKVKVFVNVHPKELTSRWLVRPDDPIGFYEHGIYIEVTEAAAFEYFDICMSVLNEVRQRTGAQIVIDDFGAGYSNLARIVDLEPSHVKLDISLVKGIDKHPRKQKLARSLVNLCAELGAEVVREGVETLDELKAVRDTGAQFAQGFYLARPARPIPDIYWPF